MAIVILLKMLSLFSMLCKEDDRHAFLFKYGPVILVIIQDGE